MMTFSQPTENTPSAPGTETSTATSSPVLVTASDAAPTPSPPAVDLVPPARTARVQVVRQPETDESGADEDGEGAEEEDPAAGLLDGVAEDAEDIDLIHLRLTNSTLSSLDLPRFANLKRLSLRQNTLSKLPFETFSRLGAGRLEELDLYDNGVGDGELEGLRGLGELETLDLSFNKIRSLTPSSRAHKHKHKHHHHHDHPPRPASPSAASPPPSSDAAAPTSSSDPLPPSDAPAPLTSEPPVQLTLAQQQQVEREDKTAPVPTEAQAQAQAEPLAPLRSLKTLYLVQNKITHITGLSHLGGTLRSLELGGNRIRKIEGLENLVNLEELWLGKNKITRLEGLATLRSLRILSMQSNRVTKLENLSSLKNLRELYLSHNGLERLEGLEGVTELTTLDVGSNKIAKIEGIAHLKKLQEFWANNNRIPTLVDLPSQLAVLPELETVYLEGNPAQTDDRANYRRKVILELPRVRQVDATFVR